MNNETKGACAMKNKVFLGGACTSNWRDKLIPALDYYEVSYFNPVVKDWTPEHSALENDEKYRKCNIHLYYFDNTMTGMYSMAEMIKSCMDSESGYVDESGRLYKEIPICLILFVLNTDGMTESQIRSFDACHSLARDVTNKIWYRKLSSDELGNLAKELKEITETVKVCKYNMSDDSLID